MNPAMDGERETVEALSERIGALVAERQALRAAAADRATLERNRLAIATHQRRLSEAVIRAHRTVAA